MLRLNFRQKCVLILIALTLTFIALSTDRVTVSHIRVNNPIPQLLLHLSGPVSTPKPQPVATVTIRHEYKIPPPKLYYARTSFPNTVTFRLKEDSFPGTTTTTLSPYQEVKTNEICKVFPGIIGPGIQGSKIEGKMFDPSVCTGSEFVEALDKDDSVKHGKFVTPNMTCCLKVKVEAPKKPGQAKAK